MRISPLILLTCIGLFALACTEATDPAALPWADATFANPLESTIQITNSSDSTSSLDLDLYGYHEDLSKQVPNSLAPDASISLKVQTHRPQYLYVRCGESFGHRLLLPGRSRSLVFTKDSSIESGAFTLEYEYLDAALSPINPAHRQVPQIDKLSEFYSLKADEVRKHLDTIVPPDNLPEFIGPMMRRIAYLHPYEDVLSMRQYYKLFFADTLELDAPFIANLDSLVKLPEIYQTPQFERLNYNLAAYHREVLWDTNTSFKANAAATMLASLTTAFPLPERQHDAMAGYAAQLIGDARVFSGKMEVIDSIKNMLSPPYLKRLADIEAKAIERAISPNGLADFLTTEFTDPNGSTASVATLSTKPLRLLKFWFAGCYPCLMQQPNEKALLAKHPDVDLVYVAHNTNPKSWQPYLNKHKPPTDLQLYVPKGKSSVIESAAGTTGAPTYVMVNAAGKTICRPCPKPSDLLLSDIITKALSKAD